MKGISGIWRLVAALCTCAVLMLSSVQGAAAEGSGDYSVTVKPGETKTVVIPVRNLSSHPSEVRYIVLTASNTSIQSRTGKASILATSACAGVQKALNAAGNTLYQWTAQAQYDFNGSTVDVWGHSGTPASWWGWSFDHNGWVIVGNNTSLAVAASTGYFKHPTIGKEYARVAFTINKSGVCTMSGTTGTW